MARLGILIVVLLAGCGGDGAGGAPDLSFPSVCGWPGDRGNDRGVGKFCQAFSDCKGNQDAILCTSVADSTRWFCTQRCEGDGGATCGDAARCACSMQGCACVPERCLHM